MNRYAYKYGIGGIMNFEVFPNHIKKKIDNQPYTYDKLGESDSTVILFDDMVLKIEKTSCQSDREYHILNWLDKKLPVPKIICFERKDGFNYLLMTKLDGSMACDTINIDKLDSIVESLADGLKQLWRIDITNCEFDSTLDVKLKEAKYNIDHNLVDCNDFEECTLGPDGFKDIDALYSFLMKNKPEEDLVFSHGDYCLPNVFINDKSAVGFLDLGKAGVADRWADIALCVRSLKYNICDLFNLPYNHYLSLKQKLYDLLEIKENEEKLRYYILLDELF